jgi:hypothetical protein
LNCFHSVNRQTVVDNELIAHNDEIADVGI